MSDPVATTLVRVRALTGDPDFLAVESAQTGRVPGSTYKPTFLGEFGWMLYADAQPLDIGVPATGDKLGICWDHTPVEIDAAMQLSIWPAAAPAAMSAPVEPERPPPAPLRVRRKKTSSVVT